MPPTNRSPFLALVIPAVVTGVSIILPLLVPSLYPYPFVSLLAAVSFSAWIGGLRGGVISLILSILSVFAFFLAPQSALPLTPVNLVRFGYFLFSGAFIIWLVYRYEHNTLRLAEERERLHVTLASIGDGVVAVDTGGQITFVNRAAEKLIGWSRVEAQGKPLDEVLTIQDESTGQRLSNLAAAVLDGTANGHLPSSALLITREGRSLPIEDSAAPIRASSGQVLGAILVFRDDTERRLNERALTEANQSFKALFDAAPLSIIVFDQQGNVRMWSPAAERMTGWTEAEVMGRIAPTIPPDRMEEFRTILETVQRENTIVDVETQRLHKNGTRLDVIVSAAPLRDAQGRLIGFISISNDITELKRTQHALRQSEQHLRDVMDSLFAFVGVLTPDGTLMQVNRAALEGAGIKPEDVLGKPFHETYWWQGPADVRERLKEAIRRGAEGQASRFDVEIQLAGERRGMIDFMIAPMFDADGRVTHLVPSAIDVTDRYEALARLAESEARYRAVGESIPFGIWITDPEGKVTYVSQSFLDMVGMTLEQCQEFGWADRLAPERREQTVADWTEHVRTGEFWSYEHQYLDVDGRWRSVLARGVPVRDASGAITSWVGVNLDITERKHEEELMLRLQQITAGLSEAVTPQQVANVVVNQVGGVLGSHILSVVRLLPDESEMEILGTHGMGRQLEERYQRMPLNHPSPLPYAVCTAEPVYIDNQEEYVARFPQVAHVIRSETHSHATACLPMKIGGRVVGGIGMSFPHPRHLSAAERRFLTAVSEQCALALERARLFEAEAEARRKAERADWLKTRFLAIVSHELRTPLTSIKGFATTLLEEDVEWDKVNQRDFLEIINNEADKLSEMIEQLLDFSRIESGNLRIQRDRTTLTDILHVVLPQLQMLAADHHLNLQIPDALPVLDADRRRIAQVITNVVGNAVRYSPPQTTITLSAHVESAHIRLDISDEGPGIPPEERDAIFEAFRQGRTNASAESKGAGLGLAIARGIIEAHEGRIWIDDRPAPGTTVSVMIPIDLRILEPDP